MQEIYEQAGVAEDQRQPIHIGGDKANINKGAIQWRQIAYLGLGNPHDTDSFKHSAPITFEFFHLMMNFLEKVIIFKRLYHCESDIELGTYYEM